MSWSLGLLVSIGLSGAWLSVGWIVGLRWPADRDQQRARYLHRREPLLVLAFNLNFFLCGLVLLKWVLAGDWHGRSLPWQRLWLGIGSSLLAATADSTRFHVREADGDRLFLVLFLLVAPMAMWMDAWWALR